MLVGTEKTSLQDFLKILFFWNILKEYVSVVLVVTDILGLILCFFCFTQPHSRRLPPELSVQPSDRSYRTRGYQAAGGHYPVWYQSESSIQAAAKVANKVASTLAGHIEGRKQVKSF